MHPDPKERYPIDGVQRVCFLKNILNRPQIEVGHYTYYDDPEDVYNFEKNVLYLFEFMGDKLIFGKFCQIATGVRFLMNGANHALDGFSTYPFKVFGKSWKEVPMNARSKGDTVIGNDVWIGNSATVLQGIKVGDGAIIGACSLVTKDVPPYAIVGGNPAQVIRKRFEESTIERLLALRWWDWPVEKITEHLNFLTQGTSEALEKLEEALEK